MCLLTTSQPAPNPEIKNLILRVRKTSIYYQLVLLSKTYYSYLHLKSGVVCPQAADWIELTISCRGR